MTTLGKGLGEEMMSWLSQGPTLKKGPWVSHHMASVGSSGCLMMALEKIEQSKPRGLP